MTSLRRTLATAAVALSLALGVPVAALAAPPATAAPTPPTSVAADVTPAPPDRVTWGIVPADAEGADGRVSIRHELDPGDVVEDHVEVTNYSDRTMIFDLVASDGIIGPDGAFDMLPSAEEPVDVGSWIEIEDTVELEAQESAVVPFTLTVPEDVLPGDHPGGIAASVSRLGESEEGPQVGFDTRVGARIHLRVSGEVEPSIAVSDLTATYEPSWNPFQPGTLQLEYTVTNDGNVRLGSVQSAAADGLFGISAADTTVVGEQREVLPRQEAQMSADIGGVWPLGVLDATVYAEQNVVGEDAIEAALVGARADATVWAVPWAQLVVLLVVVGLVLLPLRARKRRRLAMERAVSEAREEGRRDTDTAATALSDR